VFYNRKEHHVLVFNHPQNRLNVFNTLPYGAGRLIPFPFQDEQIAQLAKLPAAKNLALPAGAKEVSLPGEIGEKSGAVPIQFRVTMTQTPSGPKVGTFAIRAPDGDVAKWTFTYASENDTHSPPAVITRVSAAPIITEAERQRFLQHEAIPPTHWRPDAEIRYTFVGDQLPPAAEAPSEASLLRSASEQTTIVDRRDLKNPISFRYRKDGGDLDVQIQAARLQGASPASPDNTARIAGCLLLIPLLLGAGWVIRRRTVRPLKA